MRKLLLMAPILMAIEATVGVPAAAQSVKTGIEAWQRADYAAAVAAWRPLAESGDADAAFNLGQAYRLGRGVPIDLATAQSWFERAARNGHLDAQTTLGLLLFDSVQLGAFSKRSSAEALFAKLSGNGALPGRRSYLIPAGAVTRLQAGPFESRAAAAAACAALSAKGQPCFPVAAN